MTKTMTFKSMKEAGTFLAFCIENLPIDFIFSWREETVVFDNHIDEVTALDRKFSGPFNDLQDKRVP